MYSHPHTFFLWSNVVYKYFCTEYSFNFMYMFSFMYAFLLLLFLANAMQQSRMGTHLQTLLKSVGVFFF